MARYQKASGTLRLSDIPCGVDTTPAAQNVVVLKPLLYLWVGDQVLPDCGADTEPIPEINHADPCSIPGRQEVHQLSKTGLSVFEAAAHPFAEFDTFRKVLVQDGCARDPFLQDL